jgi:hypothetical protein
MAIRAKQNWTKITIMIGGFCSTAFKTIIASNLRLLLKLSFIVWQKIVSNKAYHLMSMETFLNKITITLSAFFKKVNGFFDFLTKTFPSACKLAEISFLSKS